MYIMHEQLIKRGDFGTTLLQGGLIAFVEKWLKSGECEFMKQKISNTSNITPEDAFSYAQCVRMRVGKKYCKEMKSCAEAKFYLTQCGLTRLDRDKDGIPCETICK
jgi:hypothetical protein